MPSPEEWAAARMYAEWREADRRRDRRQMIGLLAMVVIGILIAATGSFFQ